jgi:branched-chain amino acid transport system permease protein
MGKNLMIIAALCLGTVAPAVIYPVLLMKFMCFALFACAFNLLLGYTGLLSFGHAAFFGAAGYTAGYFIKELGVSPEVGICAGVVVSLLLGYLVGSLVIRRQGIYFAMITLALAQMVYFFFMQAPFAGGEDGLQDIPRGRLFGLIDLANDLNLYYCVLAVFVTSLWLIDRIVQSPFGHIVKAIRENEPRAISLGYDVARFKLRVFLISAGLSGLAGAMKAVVFKFATLADAHWHTSGEVVLMTILGGIGTLFGPLVGAGSIVTLQYVLADRAGSLVTVIIGASFILCVLLFRRGIIGELQKVWPGSGRFSAR